MSSLKTAIVRHCLQSLVVFLLLSAFVVDQPAADEQAFYQQQTPGDETSKFLPDVISADVRPHSALIFSPNGREMYWSGYVIGEGRAEWIFYSRRQGDSWSRPEKVAFNDGRGNGVAFSPDGSRLYFGATRALADQKEPVYTGIWYVEKTDDSWGDVKPVASTLDTSGFAGRPSMARNGNLYFLARGSRSEMPAVFRCRLIDGVYESPQKLSAPFADGIVMDPWVDPDERFILLMFDDWAGELTTRGSSDLFISYHTKDDTWSEPVSLGGAVNTANFDRSASLSPDGRYVFFIRAVGKMFVESEAHYYWISAEILDSLSE